jgi:RNA polymerase sigma-70 factor (ECF subfamily)
MSNAASSDTTDTFELLRRAERGDRGALDELFSRHRSRLRRMVVLRLARSLQGRVDASDVIQDALLEASRRFPRYLEERSMPFFLWLRFLTGQALAAIHRRHLGVKARDPRREVSLHAGSLPEATSEALAAQLLGRLTSPSQALARAEFRLRLQDALNGLDPEEREVLALRHFEQLSNAEAAKELGIKEAAASKRYVRALTRLEGILAAMNISMSSLYGEER